MTGFTLGQLAFGNASGSLTQTAGLVWDNTNGRLGIGISTPATLFHIQTTATGDILKISSGSNNIFRVQTDTDLPLDTAKVTIGSGNSAKPE